MVRSIVAGVLALACLAASPALPKAEAAATAMSPVDVQKALERIRALQAQHASLIQQAARARTIAERNRALQLAQVIAGATRQAINSLAAANRDNRR